MYCRNTKKNKNNINYQNRSIPVGTIHKPQYFLTQDMFFEVKHSSLTLYIVPKNKEPRRSKAWKSIQEDKDRDNLTL